MSTIFRAEAVDMSAAYLHLTFNASLNYEQQMQISNSNEEQKSILLDIRTPNTQDQ
jgi:hypothetical protein